MVLMGDEDDDDVDDDGGESEALQASELCTSNLPRLRPSRPSERLAPQGPPKRLIHVEDAAVGFRQKARLKGLGIRKSRGRSSGQGDARQLRQRGILLEMGHSCFSYRFAQP